MRRGDRTENVCRSTRVYVTRNAVVKSVQNMPPALNLQNTRPKTLATADPPTMMSMMVDADECPQHARTQPLGDGGAYRDAGGDGAHVVDEVLRYVVRKPLEVVLVPEQLEKILLAPWLRERLELEHARLQENLRRCQEHAAELDELRTTDLVKIVGDGCSWIPGYELGTV